MRITAEDLDGWAEKPEARSEFPALIRRLLAHSAARLRRLGMPSGSGTALPGWDGVVEAARGSAWVPEGASRWELSCEQDVARKARADLDKRTRETSRGERARRAFVFATPRKWSAKTKWLAKAKGHGWREVRAYDAHDLVQWLESAPAVALWLAERLGKAGPGVETVEQFFARWSKGSDPAITARALATGRFRAARALRRLLRDPKSPITIRADSEEEAAAFVASVLQRNPRLSARAAVLTAPSGWQWVLQNPDLRFVLCASSGLARGAPVRDGLIVLVPDARGDVSPFEHRDKTETKGPQLPLPRPDALLFARALETLGIEAPKAWALARRCGRSLSAFRRLQAVNPALRTPPWLERPEARALSVLALLGAFTESEADRSLVAEVAGRPWEELERDLRILADLPDPPVLAIGGLWKAKAIAELFLLMAPRITKGEVDRFLAVAQRLLSERDPALDAGGADDWLPITADRFSCSDVLRRSLADALPRLAVLGQGCLRAEPYVEARIREMVRDLLGNADAERWFSLRDHVPALAEAAPDEFLEAVDRDLEALTQAGSDLDTALALVAWSPAHLGWVADILCRLRRADPQEVKPQAPDRVLLDIFRPWFPQTNASLEERLEVLATLTARYPEPAFELLLGMLPGHDTASEHARPAWRDDWLRPIRVTREEWQRAVEWAADRAIALAEGNPDRLARLVEQLDGLRAAGREAAALAALDRFARTDPPDDRRLCLYHAVITSFFRAKLHRQKPFRGLARKLVCVWRALAPRDSVLRHLYLFGGALQPAKSDREIRILNGRRCRAVRKVFVSQGLAGLLRLAEASGVPQWVGAAVWRAGLPVDLEALVAAALGAEGAPSEAASKMLAGWLGRAHAGGWLRAALNCLVAAARKRGVDDRQLGRLLALAPYVPEVWDRAEACGFNVAVSFWASVNPSHSVLSASDGARAARALLAAGRPAAALDTLSKAVNPPQDAPWLEILEKLAETGPESTSDKALVSIFVDQAIKRLEADPSVDRDRLARVEFELLDHFWEIADRLTSLWIRLTSDPAFLVELVKLAFRAEGEPRRALEGRDRARAERALRLLTLEITGCPRIPGQREDRTVDRTSLERFVDQARERARAAGRLTICEQTLGQMLAGAPGEADGRWPCEPVAALLDRPELGEVRKGFAIGVLNAHATRLHPLVEGATRERAVANDYRRHARAWSARYPRTAACLSAIAKWIEHHAQRSAEMDRGWLEGLM